MSRNLLPTDTLHILANVLHYIKKDLNVQVTVSRFRQGKGIGILGIVGNYKGFFVW